MLNHSIILNKTQRNAKNLWMANGMSPHTTADKLSHVHTTRKYHAKKVRPGAHVSKVNAIRITQACGTALEALEAHAPAKRMFVGIAQLCTAHVRKFPHCRCDGGGDVSGGSTEACQAGGKSDVQTAGIVAAHTERPRRRSHNRSV